MQEQAVAHGCVGRQKILIQSAPFILNKKSPDAERFYLIDLFPCIRVSACQQDLLHIDTTKIHMLRCAYLKRQN